MNEEDEDGEFKADDEDGEEEQDDESNGKKRKRSSEKVRTVFLAPFP